MSLTYNILSMEELFDIIRAISSSSSNKEVKRKMYMTLDHQQFLVMHGTGSHKNRTP
jgi:hypothetical protein